jgi:hypothetical protein
MADYADANPPYGTANRPHRAGGQGEELEKNAQVQEIYLGLKAGVVAP